MQVILAADERSRGDWAAVTHAFVTGGHGLIGSWLVKELVARGDTVTVFGRGDGAGSALELEGVHAHVEVVRGDVRDAESVGRALAGRPTDIAFHLAAQAIVSTARRSPRETFETNVGGTWTVLEACRRAGVARVVVASSDTIYGPRTPAACTEDLPLRPSSPYDASKAAADVIARSYRPSDGMAVGVTRLANVYGGGDMNASRLVPGSVWAALAGRRPVVRSDGSPERDFLYVEDAVAAYLAIAGALERSAPAAAGEAFNAGGGEVHRVLEMVRAILSATGSSGEPEVRGTGAAPGEMDRQVVDHGKLARLTGWAPRVGLEEGVRRTVAWYRRYAPVARPGPRVPGHAPAD